jgi:hypothetical protein
MAILSASLLGIAVAYLAIAVMHHVVGHCTGSAVLPADGFWKVICSSKNASTLSRAAEANE